MPDTRRGLIYAAAAYGIWGLFPLYWKLLLPSSAGEILAHRLLWSLVVVAIVVAALRHFRLVGRLLADWRRTAAVTGAAVLISVNWITYIYGVNSGHVVETSLGYFINPLVSVLMGVLLLREQLRSWQWAAVGIGGLAVAVLTIEYGRLPWIALTLGFTFACYGLIKKKVALPADVSLFAETVAVALPAVGFLVWLYSTGDATFGTISVTHTLLLAGAGLATAVPLLFFAGAANRLPLTVIGMAQYIAPIMQFTIGVAIYHEVMPTARWIGFGLVWCALAVFTADAVRQNRRNRIILAAGRPATADVPA